MAVMVSAASPINILGGGEAKYDEVSLEVKVQATSTAVAGTVDTNSDITITNAVKNNGTALEFATFTATKSLSNVITFTSAPLSLSPTLTVAQIDAFVIDKTVITGHLKVSADKDTTFTSDDVISVTVVKGSPVSGSTISSGSGTPDFSSDPGNVNRLSSVTDDDKVSIKNAGKATVTFTLAADATAIAGIKYKLNGGDVQTLVVSGKTATLELAGTLFVGKNALGVETILNPTLNIVNQTGSAINAITLTWDDATTPTDPTPGDDDDDDDDDDAPAGDDDDDDDDDDDEFTTKNNGGSPPLFNRVLNLR